MAVTKIAQIAAVPNVVDGWIRQDVYTKSPIIQSGAMGTLPQLTEWLQGGGNTLTLDSWNPIVPGAITATDIDSVITDDETSSITPTTMASAAEVAVRLNRAQAWAATDLMVNVAGDDPLNALRQYLAAHEAYRLQAAFISTWVGVFADNSDNDSGDMINSIVGAYNLGTTTFSASAYEDTLLTLGDYMDGISLICCHSVVYNRMKKNDLIDYAKDSEGMPTIPMYRGARVLVTDAMPSTASGDGTDYTTFVFGANSTAYASAPAKVPLEVQREALQGDGGGVEYLVRRWQWCIQPRGFAYTGTATGAGPTNAVLDNAASWNRVYPSRKQIKAASLVTTESA